MGHKPEKIVAKLRQVDVMVPQGIVEVGADLVIGSGPYMLGEFERVADRWVAYSVGNGVFNSDGEHQRRGMPPYGLVIRLPLDQDAVQIRLYPMITDNLQTFWQQLPVAPAEFEHVFAVLREQGVLVADERASNVAWCGEVEAGRSIIVLPTSMAT
jgi:hypothetical protein